MKNQNAFLRQISKNGLYIILFLCIAAVGIAGYVMYRTQEEEIPVVEPVEEVQEPVFVEYEPIEIPEEEPEKEPVMVEATAPEAQAASNTVEVAVPAPVEYVTAVSGKVEIPFSGDELIKSKTFGDWRTHAGIDIAADEGSEVCAIANGVVKEVLEDEMMGHTVVIEHEDGIVSTYANLMQGIVVKAGQTVSAGDVIGGVGKSAVAECMEVSHLHLEVEQNGVQIDPMSLIE